MTVPPGRRVLTGAREIPGDQWIELRHRPWQGSAVTWEQAWWCDAIHRLDRELRERALPVGPGITRSVLLNEELRAVTLLAETVTGGGPVPWGIPPSVLQTVPTCPPPTGRRDVLWMPR